MVQPLEKIVWKFLKKLNTQLLYDPGILFPGIYLLKRNDQDLQTSIYVVALFVITPN